MTHRHLTAVIVASILALAGARVLAQIKAVVRPAPKPAWNKGILPISPESYYNAIECGKQGGDDPPCVFWDTGLCPTEDFTLAWYTPYKQVAYEVWLAVRKKQPPPPVSDRATGATTRAPRFSTRSLKVFFDPRTGVMPTVMRVRCASG